MIDKDKLRKELHDIFMEHPRSLSAFAKEIDIHFATLNKYMVFKMDIEYVQLAKIYNYVQKISKQKGLQNE